MRYLLFLLFTGLLLVSCQKPPAAPAASPNAKHYAIRGTIVAVDKPNKKATIKHDDIEGYMEGMTMESPSAVTGYGTSSRPARRSRVIWSLTMRARSPFGSRML